MRIRVLAFLCVLIMIYMPSCSTIDGYYYDIDDAKREHIELYDGNLVFSTAVEEVIIDFVMDIDEQQIYIVFISTKVHSGIDLYRIKQVTHKSLKEQRDIFYYKNAYDFERSNFFDSVQLRWCIVTKTFNDNNNCYPAYEFEYEGEIYHLRYVLE